MHLMDLTGQDQTRIVQLDAILKPYTMQDHPGMRHMVEHGMPLSVAVQIAREYGPANAASPQIMASGITQIWNDLDLLLILVCNLHDECGKGIKADSHITMFERFMVGVGVDPANCMAQEGSKTEQLIEGFLMICREGPDYRALAVLHGFEAVFPYICDSVGKALEKSAILSAEAALFFSHHAIADLEHAATTRAAMLKSANTEDKWRECLKLAEFGASLVYELYDSIITPAAFTHHKEAQGTLREAFHIGCA